MNYVPVIRQCANARVAEALVNAIEELFQNDRELMELDAAERTIAAHLAGFLRPFFPGYHVDVEYNRMGRVPKRVMRYGEPDRVYPDIIVHVRQRNDGNLLVLELKKSSNQEGKAEDLEKLRAYRRELSYQNALFIRLGVGDLAGTVTEIEWV